MGAPFTNDRQFQANCRAIIDNFEETLDMIIEHEVRQIDSVESTGDTEFKVAKDVHIRQGEKQGLRRVMQLIHKYGRGEEK